MSSFFEKEVPSLINLPNDGNVMIKDISRVAVDFVVINNGTPQPVTGLTFPVIAGRTYIFTAILHCTITAAQGIIVQIAGTATATNIIVDAVLGDITSGLTLWSRVTALAANMFVGSNVFTPEKPFITIRGTITVNAGGTLIIKAAQDVAAPATQINVLRGSYFEIAQANE